MFKCLNNSLINLFFSPKQAERALSSGYVRSKGQNAGARFAEDVSDTNENAKNVDFSEFHSNQQELRSREAFMEHLEAHRQKVN